VKPGRRLLGYRVGAASFLFLPPNMGTLTFGKSFLFRFYHLACFVCHGLTPVISSIIVDI
jgi:hypothetical protein